jgi:hypothetical protein
MDRVRYASVRECGGLFGRKRDEKEEDEDEEEMRDVVDSQIK